MGWFLCTGKSKKKANQEPGKKYDDQIPSKIEKLKSFDVKKEASKDGGSGHIAAHTFTFCELATAAKHFRADFLLGEGGFGRVYKDRCIVLIPILQQKIRCIVLIENHSNHLLRSYSGTLMLASTVSTL